jgi:ABC-type cobalt transport system substrate-binding protein
MMNVLVCFLISAVCLIVVVRCFVANQVYRGAIDAALARISHTILGYRPNQAADFCVVFIGRT